MLNFALQTEKRFKIDLLSILEKQPLIRDDYHIVDKEFEFENSKMCLYYIALFLSQEDIVNICNHYGVTYRTFRLWSKYPPSLNFAKKIVKEVLELCEVHIND